MGDLILIRGKGGRGKDGGGEKPPSNPTPMRPRKPIIRSSDIKPFIEDPSIDPNLINLIDLPLPLPILRKEIQRQEAQNPVEKEIDLMKRYKEKPLLFWRDELGIPIEGWRDDKPPKEWKPGDPVPLWSKQREIIKALVEHRKVAVKSGHGLGKTHLAAGITLYLAYVWHATGMTTAPCFDKETEILTDGGWKFLKDLTGEEKVSQYDPITEEMTFVKPLEYYKVPYKGKLLGIKNQLVDALMTPDHRCWVKMKETRWGDKEFGIKYAKDIYKNGSWRVQKSVKWKGQESIFSKDWMEFLGFWFAEGNCGYHPERGSYNVGVTQAKPQNISYVDDLFRRIGLQDKVKKKKRKKDDCYDWNIYSKELAAQFKPFGKSKVRSIPRWILELDKEYLEAFMQGFWMGDGTSEKYSEETKKGGWWALATSSNQLADDLLEICVKLGWVANKAEYKYKGEAERFGSAYTVSVWKRGHQAQVTRYDWYEVDYDDFVYCVKVPTQLILVRRKGKYHISGNSFRQVRRALWGEIHYQHVRARTPLGGKMNQVSLDLGPKWFVEGFATDKPMDNNFSNLENKIKGGNAVGFCDELARRKYAGVSSWKLPTQKQLMQAYIDGSSSLTDSSSYFWSGTEFFGDSKRAWVVNLLAGDVASSPKENTASNFVKCVAETK